MVSDGERQMKVVDSTTVSITPRELDRICMGWGDCGELSKRVVVGEDNVPQIVPPCQTCPLSGSSSGLYNRQIVIEVIEENFIPCMKKRTDGVIVITYQGICNLCRVIRDSPGWHGSPGCGVCSACPLHCGDRFPHRFAMVIEQ